MDFKLCRRTKRRRQKHLEFLRRPFATVSLGDIRRNGLTSAPDLASQIVLLVLRKTQRGVVNRPEQSHRALIDIEVFVTPDVLALRLVGHSSTPGSSPHLSLPTSH